MTKRILIFADGTGNEGGLLPDESRTNVYKLYRATRNDPESSIAPPNASARVLRTPGQARKRSPPWSGHRRRSARRTPRAPNSRIRQMVARPGDPEGGGDLRDDVWPAAGSVDTAFS